MHRLAIGLVLLLALGACGPLTAPMATSTPAAVSAPTTRPSATRPPSATPTPTSTPMPPLSIAYMRSLLYPGSEVTVEQTLEPGSNYSRFLVSYRSDGLKIYALMTVPAGDKPESGWPVVIFNHGYIPPAEYRPTERYVAYVDAFARSGYIVFRPDYRGNGDSEGRPMSAYASPAYTVDVLNAVSSVKRCPDADPERIGMWGHSMGGGITLRAMVVSKDIKAGVIWAGTVGPTLDMLEKWGHPPTTGGDRTDELTARYGSPEENPAFWESIYPNAFLAGLSGPLQLHHGTADEEVPLAWSEMLYDQVRQAGKPVELYTYEGDNHNLSNNLGLALQRSVEFFDRYLK